VAFTSDRRLKKIKGNIPNALEKISKINGVYYELSSLGKKLNVTDINERDVGLIAQEVQAILPEVVSLAPFDRDKYGKSKSGEDYLTVQYNKIIPLLIEALKEQKDQIDYINSKL
jgi:hypothetical protein